MAWDQIIENLESMPDQDEPVRRAIRHACECRDAGKPAWDKVERYGDIVFNRGPDGVGQQREMITSCGPISRITTFEQRY